MASNSILDQSYMLIRELTPEQRYRAARMTAAHASGADDLAELLDVLGINAEDGRPPRAVPDERPAAVRSGPPPEFFAELVSLPRLVDPQVLTASRARWSKRQ